MKKTSPLKTISSWLRSHRGLSLSVLATILFLSLSGTVFARTSLTASATLQSVERHQVDKPVTITLNQKLKQVDISKITISPVVEGSWQFKRNTFTKDDQLTFTPSSYFLTDTTYTVTLPEIPRAFFGHVEQQSINFTTEAAPNLTNTGLVALKDKSIIAADNQFQVALNSPNRKLRDIQIKTSPALKLTGTIESDMNYTWKSSSLLPQGKDISIEIIDRKNNVVLLEKKLRVAKQPTVSSPLSRSSVGKTDTITIDFSTAIAERKDQDPRIQFSTPGSGKWKTSATYAFTPDKLFPGKTYSFTVKAGLRSEEGGLTTKKITGKFNTVGPVMVISSSPYGQELLQSRQTIRMTFSQPVDHASAQSKFSISSGKINDFSWQGNTMSVTVTKLGYQKTVTASIGSGVKNTEFGLPSNQSFTHSFTTEIRSKRLNVPHYTQQHSASCAVASLRMILAYRGVNTSELSIVGKMGYAPKKMNTKTKPATWDDPALMFVGSIDGSLRDGTGAGPDAPPVAKAAQAYGRSASAVRGIGTGWIAQQIYAGNPVVMFGATRAGSGFVTWKTPSGRTTKMNRSSHATVVLGVHGEPHAPIGFWVSDPLAGGVAYWSTGAVEANIARDAYRQAVVIY